MSAVTSATETAGGRWVYVAEGGANVVFAYTGSDSEQYKNKVLRIGKELKPSEAEKEALSYTHQIEYSKTVFALAGISEKYICSAAVWKCPNSQTCNSLKAALTERKSSRPLGLLHINYGILMGNAFCNEQGGCPKTGFKFALEIKPKSGVLPSSSYIEESPGCRSGWKKKSKSRYQRHQKLKLKKNKINVASEYDPLDLFSCDLSRVKKALHALIENPQNNFRPFLLDRYNNGQHVKIEAFEKYCMENFSAKSTTNINAPEARETIVALVAKVLVEESLLPELRNIQAMDDIDIEGIAKLNLDSFAKFRCSDDLLLSNVLKAVDTKGFDATFCANGNKIDVPISQLEAWNEQSSTKSNRGEVYISILRRFLLAATAKDVSIILAISMVSLESDKEEAKNKCGRFIEIKNKFRAYYSVKLVDTDFKHSSKFDYWKKLDLDISNANSTLTERGRGAVKKTGDTHHT